MKLIQTLIAIVAPCIVCGGDESTARNNTEPLVQTGAKWEVIGAGYQASDGPAWDGRTNLYFPDVRDGKIWRYNVDDKKVHLVVADAGRISASNYDHKNDRLLLSNNGAGRISYLDGDSLVPIVQHPVDAKPPFKPNDLVADDRGGVYHTFTGKHSVFYLNPSGKLIQVIDDIKRPNGITLSLDGKTLYVASYNAHEVWAYSVQPDGNVENGRMFCSWKRKPKQGADGLTIDALGNLYCAGSDKLWVWNPQGKLISKIDLPDLACNCAFGDKDGRGLYISTFTTLYRIRMNVAGGRITPASRPKNPIRHGN
jgi:gluconolactonase